MIYATNVALAKDEVPIMTILEHYSNLNVHCVELGGENRQRNESDLSNIGIRTIVFDPTQ